MQHRTRKECRFVEAEANLPDYSDAVSPTSSQLSTTNKISDLLSYLGSKNPLPRPVSSKDTVWLLDNTAYRNARTGRWEAEFVAATFSQDTSYRVVDAAGSVAKQIGLEETDPDYPTIGERVLPFLQDIRPGTKVKVLQNGDARISLGPTGRNGVSSNVKTVPHAPHTGDGSAQHLVPTFAAVPKGANGLLEMRTFYAEPEGWAVISDIDDTIKVTMTSDPIGILKSTFVDTPTPTPGMPELYAYIQSLIRKSSPFFYLSASPYNLYPFLRDFRDHHYPHGTIVLRDSNFMSLSGLLSQLTLGTGEYKVDRMRKINSWVPERKMICIGDSTQADPESYGEIYREFPGWVHLILIRKVTDIAAIGIEAKNEPSRFEEAFQGVPRDRWHVFEDADECRDIIERRQKSSKDVPYELIYWSGLPGRGEHVRLALEEGGATYTDTAHTEGGTNVVLAQIDNKNLGDDLNPPPLAPPILKHGDLLISQTSNILMYLGPRLKLAGGSPAGGNDEEEGSGGAGGGGGAEVDADAIYRINQLALTALDGLSNEPHDCHHPIATDLYYEDQKPESLRKSKNFVTKRLPKFLGYFERVIEGKASGDGPWLYGGRLTYADLVLYQCLDGVTHAFPKAIDLVKKSGKYDRVFKLYEAVQERPRIKEYLASERRQKYGMGIYRYYEELDVVPSEEEEK
ncbi:hypothetical protein BX600DRAFT_484565 [Xylariales sp. PMI_506]|nr:hypothetical protein BX600DRAFT_484565 [Xylariales sp. PMI_506]